ncbi:alpha/beta-hydrolase [Stereum hirsutum FP-91666 SS1]|uniref:alpha/beta-hydrolase n=1 Tax=Stereum hirsutum (strain FP-91666) TaxID=721885 RepID=UPI0004449924|nr:alpha/beta-hydrolase [Stereum hirsutum FP-91666 SS1]EIM83284.1 alpha/beta-hydrolase [Stereum hirsutum FP-91666 SS1]
MSTASTAKETPLSGACTKDCWTAVKHTGTPAGSFEKIGGLDTYISLPPADSKYAHAQGGGEGGVVYERVLLWFPDVFSSTFLNNKLVMDWFASRGYLVLGPDYFLGDPIYLHRGVDPNFDGSTWIPNKRKLADSLVPPWIEAVKAKYGTEKTKWVCSGYCFGAPDVLKLLAEDWVTAGAFAHPAMVTEEMFQGVKKPLLLCCSEIDHTFSAAARHKAEEILVDPKYAPKPEYYLQLYGGVAHGWSLRGDPTIERERWSKDECARSMDAWFDRFCSLT